MNSRVGSDVGSSQDASPGSEAKPRGASSATGEPADGVESSVTEVTREADLTPDSAYRLTAASAARFLVVAGPVASGKTTLIASIYERFLRSSAFARYCFAGSETLIGLEMRSHLARIASGGNIPATARTRGVERISLLHLRVRREDLSQQPRDLLFTDLSGEVFEAAKDSSDACRALEYLLRADRIVLLIDGAQLASTGERFAAISAANDFLRRCYDTGMLGLRSFVDVLITKWDKIELLQADQRDGAISFSAHAESQLRDDFSKRFRSIRFARVAAQPEPPSLLSTAHGLESIFAAWIEETGFFSADPDVVSPPILEREIDRFQAMFG